MSNAAKPARLWLRDVRGKKLWYIRDDGRKIATGCGADDRAGAEEKLAEYITARVKPRHDSGRDPAAITIAELLNIYQQDRGAKIASPQELGQRVTALLGFFGTKPVTALNKRLCRDYAVHRGSDHAARRQLEDLRAALGHAFEEKILDIDFRRDIELPPKAAARERWLTRSEAARLLWAAWRYREVQNFRGTNRKTRQHVARFILVALYTGTRSAAVCGAAMGPAIGRGYVDLEQGVLYRRAPGTAETSKRQPPVRLPDRLLAHMRRWGRRGISSEGGRRVQRRAGLERQKGVRPVRRRGRPRGQGVAAHAATYGDLVGAAERRADLGCERLLRRDAGSDQSRLWAPLPRAAQGGRRRHHPQAAGMKKKPPRLWLRYPPSGPNWATTGPQRWSETTKSLKCWSE